MGGVLDLGQVVGPQGPQGPKGDTGAQGNTGPQGVQGANGITPNIQVGTVTTLPPGSDAYFSRQEDSPDAAPVFDVGLPRGADSVNDGDMKAEMYDPTGKGEDIFAYADAVLDAAKAYAEQYGYSKTETLSDETKTLYGKGSSASPDEIFAAIRPLITEAKNMALVQTGYYTGTGERVKQKINVGFNLKFLCISLLTSKVGSSGVKALIAAGNALSYCCIYPYGTSGNCSGYVASYPDSAENEFAVENDLNISGAKYFYIAIG